MRSPHRLRLLLSSCMLGIAADAPALDVLVVTDQNHPVSASPGAHVIYLDAPANVQAEVSSGLPPDPHQAAAMARERLNRGGRDLQRRLAAAYQDVVTAWRLGVAKIPAVVVDRQYVIYGEANVELAVARIQKYRSVHR